MTLGLRGIGAGELTGVKIPSSTETLNGQSVVVATWEASPLFAALRDDTLDTWIRQHPRWTNNI